MTIQEAKDLMTPESREKLHELISKPDEIDVSKKVGNDIVMAAFCQAALTGVIQPRSLSERLVKLLNSDTNTISDLKLDEILKVVHKNQPNMVCDIRLCDENNKEIVVWRLYEDFKFAWILTWLINRFEITPQMVRTKLADTLKTTIVNNVSQLVSKHLNSTPEEQNDMRISITTITRLVNMTGHILTAKFLEDPDNDKNNHMIWFSGECPEAVALMKKMHPDMKELTM